MRRTRSLDAGYFETLYRRDPDPWNFETSAYEHAKYDATLAAMGDEPVERALEIGCSVGVLTERLARRCRSVLAVDVSATALRVASKRCEGMGHVQFRQIGLPSERPSGAFDLVLMSEVAYYWDSGDLRRMGEALKSLTLSKGRVLLVHWTGETDYPMSADDAVEGLWRAAGESFTIEQALRTDAYRLELWRRLA